MSSPKLCCRCFQSIGCNGFHHSLLQIEIKQSFHAEREPIFHGKWLFVKLSSKPAENPWTRLPKPATLLRVFGVNAAERSRDPDPLPALAQPGPPRTRAPASRHVALSSFSLSYIDFFYHGTSLTELILTYTAVNKFGGWQIISPSLSQLERQQAASPADLPAAAGGLM